MAERHIVVIQPTHEAFLTALGLPADVRILAVLQQTDDLLAGTCQIIIEHDSLPRKMESAMPRYVTLDEAIGMLKK